MVSGYSVEENPIPQQSKKAAQEEQQASDSNQYICITRIEVVWSRSPLSPLSAVAITTSKKRN